MSKFRRKLCRVKTKAAMDHAGNGVALTKLFGFSSSGTVYRWGEYMPENWARQFIEMTEGDFDDYHFVYADTGEKVEQ